MIPQQQSGTDPASLAGLRTGVSDRTDLKADCTQCAALCCVAFPFDRNEDFAIDKAAGEPCLHIGACGECRIHHSRPERGFSGCVAFECFGAGQRVVQTMFKGRSWQDEPALLRPMMEAFRPMKKACELLFAVSYAKRQRLLPHTRARLDEIEDILDDLTDNMGAGNFNGTLPEIEREVRGIFSELRGTGGRLLPQVASVAT